MIRNNERGFTLVELLVVMIIIGILTSIIAGNFVGTRVKARDARRKSDLEQMQHSLEAYYNDHGQYPVGVGGKMQNDVPTVLDWGESLMDSKNTVYMATLPIDPSGSGATYYYVTHAGGTKYQIFAYLENDKDTAIISALAPLGTTPVCVTSGSKKCNWGVSSANAKITDSPL